MHTLTIGQRIEIFEVIETNYDPEYTGYIPGRQLPGKSHQGQSGELINISGRLPKHETFHIHAGEAKKIGTLIIKSIK